VTSSAGSARNRMKRVWLFEMSISRGLPMRRFMFLCPNTGYIVQARADDATPGVRSRWPQVSQAFTTRAVVIATARGFTRLFGSRRTPLKSSVLQRRGTHFERRWTSDFGLASQRSARPVRPVRAIAERGPNTPAALAAASRWHSVIFFRHASARSLICSKRTKTPDVPVAQGMLPNPPVIDSIC
jgi:hypothetical protein